MILEVREYVIAPGQRDAFAAFFRAEVIPRMEAAGMQVVGAFGSVTHENVFAYARTFASLEEREAQYRAFYGSEDWLGWLIDFAMGKEESFQVFLGDSETFDQPHSLAYSGVHAERFVLANAKGPITAVDADRILVADEDTGTELAFVPHVEVQVRDVPNGRGTGPAVEIALGDLEVGQRVLILGAQTAEGAVARQVVRRPPL